MLFRSYFEGTVTGTTRQRLGLPAPCEEFNDTHLASQLAATIQPGGRLVINTYRHHASIRILELFGKRFAFRGREELASLLGAHGFQPLHCAGSGNIYDVEVYLKKPSPEGPKRDNA